jgi:hypothetical protein
MYFLAMFLEKYNKLFLELFLLNFVHDYKSKIGSERR